ncbi:AAC(3) family N-acetyltransferase, partial [Streptomyces niveiscabiei]
VLMLGAPRDTLTLLHHAEHLADIPGKRTRRIEVPLATPNGTRWCMIEEFDTGDPIVDGLAEDYFADIVTEFLASGQ